MGDSSLVREFNFAGAYSRAIQREDDSEPGEPRYNPGASVSIRTVKEGNAYRLIIFSPSPRDIRVEF